MNPNTPNAMNNSHYNYEQVMELRAENEGCKTQSVHVVFASSNESMALTSLNVLQQIYRIPKCW